MKAKLEAQGFVRRHLKLELKDPQMQPIQCRGRYNTQPNQTRSAEKWTADAIRRDWIEEIEYREELFIRPQFFKEKKGRVDADGDLLVRPLIDMSLLSAAIKPYGYYVFSMSEIQKVIVAIPSNSEYFIDEDLESAFNNTPLGKNSWKYCAVWILGKLYWYKVCGQGLSVSATWFNCQLDNCYNAVLGLFWHSYFIKFVDDHLVMADTEKAVIESGEILDAALEVFGYPVSAKTPNTPKNVGELTSLRVTAEGISLNGEGVDSLKVALDMVPRTLSDCRSLIGAILYAHTAFNWDVNEMCFFVNQLSPMHATVTACAVNRETEKCANKFVLTEECEEARQRLIATIEVVPT